MFEEEKKQLTGEIIKFCKQKELPSVKLDWRDIPFSGEWGIALPFFSLAAAAKREQDSLPVHAVAQKLSEECADYIGVPHGFSRVEAKKGYLNFYFSTNIFAEKVLNDVIKLDLKYGFADSTEKTIMVEFSQPNTHKSMHVGHLRNLILGSTVSNILEAAGNTIIRANYLGDIGLHVIKWLYNYETNHKGEQPVDNPTRWMGNLYAEADRLFVDDPDFETGVRKYFQRWDEKDPDVVALWKKTRKWSIDGFDQIYEQLGVKFDKVYFESEVEESGKVVVEELIKKGIAIDDRPEGPVYVDLDTLLNTKEEFRIAVILRSDGTSLYATKELPLAIQKFKEYNLDKSIYVVDVRQSLHMKQIFKILDLMGYEWSKKLEHLAYEIVNLPGNVTMSSREGTVVLIEDLIQESTKRALEIVSEKNPDLTQTQKNKIAYDVAIGAIKYPMLSRENTKIVTFDWESALDFNGQSAPYIQYAHVRAGSILKKMGEIILDPIRIVTPLEKIEINIIEQLTRLPDEIKRASNELKPSIITNYAYNLARTFNEFYNLCPVLSVEFDLKMLRLAIVKSTQNCLAVCLNLLGISAPQTM